MFDYHEPHPLLATMILACCKVDREPHSLFLVCMHETIVIYSCTEPRPSINYCWRGSTPAECQGILFCNYVQQTYSLHEATSTYTSHVLVFASLQVATPTEPLRYLFIYHEYTLLGTYNALLTQFLNMFYSLPMWVTSRSDPDCYLGQWVNRVSSHDPVSKLIDMYCRSQFQ